MIVREASSGDIREIQSLSLELGYGPTDSRMEVQRIETVLSSTNDRLWVCEDDGKLLGWIHVFKALRVASAPFLEIGGLVVSGHVRRQGVGGKLVERAILEAERSELNLRVRCNGKREEAHRFYRALGLVEAKEQKVFEYRFQK